MLLGRATPEATSRYTSRHAKFKDTGFYRRTQGLTVSSLGLGTYLGDMSVEADSAYTEAIQTALRGGVNFIDTSLNYRNQRSERAIGQAIILLMQQPKDLDRDEFVVCTKAGYLVRDAVPAELQPSDIVGRMHSLAPVFLADQLERSRRNLGLETIDVFYLHNPETQFGFVDHEEFYRRMSIAFEFLESAAADRKIQFYGAATWEGFRKPHALSLIRMERIAREVGGADHRFRFIQLPYNLAMPEAFTSRHEVWDGGQPATVLQAAEALGITAVSSASILQAKLASDLPQALSEDLPGLRTDAQRAIQFSRSAPGIAVSLVGMGRADHVAENLGIAGVHPLDATKYGTLFQSKQR